MYKAETRGNDEDGGVGDERDGQRAILYRFLGEWRQDR